MSRYIIKMNLRQGRRLNSMLRSTESVLILVNENKLHIIQTDSAFFKIISFPIDQPDSEAYLIPSSLLTGFVSNEGYGVFDFTGSQVSTSFYTGEIKEDSKPITHSIGLTNFLQSSSVTEYLKILNVRNNRVYQIDVFKDLKQIISACSATQQGLSIFSDILITENNNIKIFINPKTKLELNSPMGLTNEALKEIDKFNPDDLIVDYNNYLILQKEGYTLGVRKAICNSQTTIPQNFIIDNGCIGTFVIDFENLINFISNNAKLLGSTYSNSDCTIDLKNNLMCVSNDTNTYKISTNIKILNNTKDNQLLKVQIKDLLPLTSLLGGKITTCKVSLFPHVLKITKGDYNILIRYKVGAFKC